MRDTGTVTAGKIGNVIEVIEVKMAEIIMLRLKG
jgi:hypothetical protein